MCGKADRHRHLGLNGIGNWIDLADSNFVWQLVGGPCIKTSMGKVSIALDLEAEIMLLLQSVSPFHQLLTTIYASSAEAQLHCW